MTAPEKDEVREDQVVEETEAAGTAASEAEDTQAAEQAPEGNDSENEAEDPIEAAKKELLRLVERKERRSNGSFGGGET